MSVNIKNVMFLLKPYAIMIVVHVSNFAVVSVTAVVELLAIVIINIIIGTSAFVLVHDSYIWINQSV